jgi:hypothetical protein
MKAASDLLRRDHRQIKTHLDALRDALGKMKVGSQAAPFFSKRMSPPKG